jgi:ABC-type sulfate transport system permease component
MNREPVTMRKLLHLSLAMTVAGVLLTFAASAGDFGSGLQLAGLLLAWAGIVKVAVVMLWTRVAGLGSDRHHPIPPS